MVQLNVYTHGLCPYAQRVALALAWTRLPHKRHEIDLANKPDWYRKRLKTNLVPAVEIDGEPMAESLDICFWIAEQATDPATAAFSSLEPADAEAALAVGELVRFSRELESAGWAMLGGAWSFGGCGGSRAKWDAAVGVLAESIATHGGPFLVGKRPTLADVALAPFVARFELAASACFGHDVRAQSEALDGYLGALYSDAAWCMTWPDRDAFGRAIARYRSLDYFDYHTSSLAQPDPENQR